MDRDYNRRVRTRAFLLATLTTAAVAASAHAGTPARWERLTGLDDANTFQLGLARTADGVLHATWLRTEPGGRSLHHTPIAANGRFGATTQIQPEWVVMANSDLVLSPEGGLRVFFGGQRTTVTGDPHEEMNTATADASGAAWALAPASITDGTGGAADAGAAAAADGTPFVSWGATVGVFVHRGGDPGPAFDFQGPAHGGCCGYTPDLALDGATGQLTVAWYSNATGRLGVWAQSVDGATGAPVGAPMRMPGSVTPFSGAEQSSQMISRTPIAGRPGRPGVFVAYPGGYPGQDRVLLWRVGDSRSRTLTRARNVQHDIVGIAAAPNGRLWAFWSEKGAGGYRIVATRSDPGVGAFGERVEMRPPRGSVDDFHLQGNAQNGRLDLFGHFGTVSGNSTWHRQVLPGLALEASARRVRGDVVVRALVTDAGDPVRGATVRAGGETAQTNRRGRALLELGSAGRRLAVTAADAGFTAARERVRVSGR
jgi:hypothetical protein